VNVPNVYLWPEASLIVQPFRLTALEVMLVSRTHSAFRLVVVRLSLPGELYCTFENLIGGAVAAWAAPMPRPAVAARTDPTAIHRHGFRLGAEEGVSCSMAGRMASIVAAAG
jgi:hypothetical protein